MSKSGKDAPAPPSTSDISEAMCKTDLNEFAKSTDFANYFCTYGFLYHQKSMLEDERRMDGYYNGVMKNKACFKDKVVLDMGAGTGVLAMWAAKAGARKVYAVEATSMAKMARMAVEHNGLSDTVTVLEGKMEDVELPEKVDIIISEWMGYFLLRESMLDSVLVARDKYLKEGGALYPSHARLFLSAFEAPQQAQSKLNGFQRETAEWEPFTQAIHDKYQLDFSVLTKHHTAEQDLYHKRTGVWMELDPSQLLTTPVVVGEFDLLEATVESIAVVKSGYEMRMRRRGQMSGIVGWFDVSFAGSEANPATETVILSTAPDQGYTHWGQHGFFVVPSPDVSVGDEVKGNMLLTRKNENQRLMDVRLDFTLKGRETLKIDRTWQIE